MSLVLAYVRPDEALMACDTFAAEGEDIISENMGKFMQLGNCIVGVVGIKGEAILWHDLWTDSRKVMDTQEHLIHMKRLRDLLKENSPRGEDMHVPDIELLIASPAGDCIQVMNSGYVNPVRRWQAIGAAPGVILAHYCFRQTSKMLEREEVLDLFGHIFTIVEQNCDSVRKPWIWMSTKEGYLTSNELEGTHHVRD